MKISGYIDADALQTASPPVQKAEIRPNENAHSAARPPAKFSAFPVKLLALSLLITSITVAWATWPQFRSPSGVPVSRVVLMPGLLCLVVVAWSITARSMLQQQRATLAAVGAMGDRQQLLEERQLLRTIIDNLPDQIYAKDRLGRFMLNNLAHAASLGVKSPGAMLGKTDFDYFPEHLATQFFADEQALISSGNPVLNQEQFIPVSGCEGKYYWVSASKVLWRDLNGKVIGTAGITRDINESKMSQEALRLSEEKLRESSIYLDRSNRELQDFAYVASHDLQEPLRKIVVFGERLKEHCPDDQMSTQARDYLDRMQKAATRMQVLIGDLLAFSRITTRVQTITSVDLGKLAREVVSDLEGRMNTNGRIDVGPMPVIEADAVQMRQLLQNLISNALKFHQPGEVPVVAIQGRIIDGVKFKGKAKAGLCEVTVTDCGIGFDEKYLDKIFNVFQRLHARNEYEGSGMGLAIARKIVLFHGGDITAKSRPGQGATFIVTLPVAQLKEGNS